MRLPRMILFDYGHTLMHEPGWDNLRGTEALMPYITANPRGLTAAEITDYAAALSARTVRPARAAGLELHEWHFMRLLYEQLQIEFSCDYPALERIYWNGVSPAPGEAMPHAADMLAYIRARGIRSGVISNIIFSGGALSERIAQLLPAHRFEFIMASSEYHVCKPNPLLFETALRKANLPPEDVWFCGDNVVCDVEGAAAVGMFPVWYTAEIPDQNPFAEAIERPPACDHLHIRDWRELIGIIEGSIPISG